MSFPSRRTAARPSGFTLVEVMVTVAVIGVMALLMMPIADSSLSTDDLEASARRGVDALREAQAATMSGRGNQAWGVHFQGDRVVVFGGSAYSAADPDNRVLALSANARVTSVSLTPGSGCSAETGVGDCEVLFSDATGRPDRVGSVILSSPSGEVRTVSINAEGLSDYQ